MTLARSGIRLTPTVGYTCRHCFEWCGDEGGKFAIKLNRNLLFRGDDAVRYIDTGIQISVQCPAELLFVTSGVEDRFAIANKQQWLLPWQTYPLVVRLVLLSNVEHLLAGQILCYVHVISLNIDADNEDTGSDTSAADSGAIFTPVISANDGVSNHGEYREGEENADTLLQQL